jgi:DNA polymerase III delta subunit
MLITDSMTRQQLCSKLLTMQLFGNDKLMIINQHHNSQQQQNVLIICCKGLHQYLDRIH